VLGASPHSKGGKEGTLGAESNGEHVLGASPHSKGGGGITTPDHFPPGTRVKGARATQVKGGNAGLAR